MLIVYWICEQFSLVAPRWGYQGTLHLRFWGPSDIKYGALSPFTRFLYSLYLDIVGIWGFIQLTVHEGLLLGWCDAVRLIELHWFIILRCEEVRAAKCLTKTRRLNGETLRGSSTNGHTKYSVRSTVPLASLNGLNFDTFYSGRPSPAYGVQVIPPESS